MNIWIIPITCCIGWIIVAIPSLHLLQIVEKGPELDTIYYLSIRVEDVSLDQISEHVHKIDRELQFGSSWVEPYIRDAIAKHPGGKLFFYNTPEEEWRAHGGHAGYAILLDNKIVWKRRIVVQ